MSDQPLFVTLGAHVLDVHAKYVEAIPEGQGGALIEEIRVSPAGAAGGTAITLAKLGARVASVGALGADDLGDLMVTMLGRLGVETDHLARKDGAQTSASVLPIRPNGDRPALHVIGANGSIPASSCFNVVASVGTSSADNGGTTAAPRRPGAPPPPGQVRCSPGSAPGRPVPCGTPPAPGRGRRGRWRACRPARRTPLAAAPTAGG